MTKYLVLVFPFLLVAIFLKTFFFFFGKSEIMQIKIVYWKCPSVLGGKNLCSLTLLSIVGLKRYAHYVLQCILQSLKIMTHFIEKTNNNNEEKIKLRSFTVTKFPNSKTIKCWTGGFCSLNCLLVHYWVHQTHSNNNLNVFRGFFQLFSPKVLTFTFGGYHYWSTN